jgi:hypothetical protein
MEAEFSRGITIWPKKAAFLSELLFGRAIIIDIIIEAIIIDNIIDHRAHHHLGWKFWLSDGSVRSSMGSTGVYI